jgi:hypothetical protein
MDHSISVLLSCVIGLPLFIWFVGTKAFEALGVICIMLYPVMLVGIIVAMFVHYL